MIKFGEIGEKRIHTDVLKKYIGEDRDPLTHLRALASTLAAVDRKFEPVSDLSFISDRFFALMANNYFLPNPEILFQDTKKTTSLLTDTALKPTDDFDDIFNCLKRVSILLQHDVQVAVDFTNLRASRSQLTSGPRQSLGPVRFMELFERAPQKREKKTALRFYLNVDHLDIESYLSYIESRPKNIRFALGLSDDFMQAVSNKKQFGLKHKNNQKPSTWTDARELIQKIRILLLEEAPLDLFFEDQIERFKLEHNLPTNAILNANNQLIEPSELTSTGAINLSAFTHQNALDEDKLSQTLLEAIHFLDNSFELNFYPDETVKAETKRSRRIAISVLGLDETLAELNPERGEKKTNRILIQLQNFLNKQSILASETLGEKRGLRNKIYFAGTWHKTRHNQILSQIHHPLLSQIMRTELYTKKLPHHQVWQKGLNNVASYKYKHHDINSQNCTKVVFDSFEKGSLSFELA